MFEIMESRVLAVLLSTFLVVAFITEKAAGFTAPRLRCPPRCKKKKENYREVDLLPQRSFELRRYHRKSETYSLVTKKKQTNKAKQGTKNKNKLHIDKIPFDLSLLCFI